MINIKNPKTEIMTTKTTNLGIIHKVLILFVILNIIGDIGNVAFWWATPSSRISLNPSMIGNAVGADTALIIASAILLVISFVYIASLYGLLKKMKWATLLVIAISVANRALAVFLYQISAAFVFWAIWTVILVIVSCLDYKKMKALATAKSNQ
jgi:hypothetical protein